MTIAERIRAARKAAGLTQKELGERMGVSSVAVTQYESGKRIPKVDTLQRIADALGIDIGVLVHGIIGTVPEFAEAAYEADLPYTELLQLGWETFKKTNPMAASKAEEKLIERIGNIQLKFDSLEWLKEGLTKLGFSNFTDEKLEMILNSMEDMANRLGLYDEGGIK